MHNRKVKIAAWISLIVFTFTLLVLAKKQRDEREVADPVISISVIDENAFLTENELLLRLKRNRLIYPGQRMQELNTTAIETYIRKMHEVEEVEVYKRYGGIWNVYVKVRQPFARIYNRKGQSFYVDAKGATMNPSPNFTARVVVFSGNIGDSCDSLTVDQVVQNEQLRKSRCLDDIFRIAQEINKNPFLKAQIAQVHRDMWGDYIFIPQVGNHEIIFGTANSEQEIKEKLNKLLVFYKEGLPFEGWNKYKTINLKYKNQIVCQKHNSE